jgi:hypothetical protein
MAHFKFCHQKLSVQQKFYQKAISYKPTFELNVQTVFRMIPIFARSSQKQTEC